ncbi:MAG: hypothetical protein MR742_12290 [Clostridiales bacterium]|nr:hypothetical protein [Clostridiales bacterium]
MRLSKMMLFALCILLAVAPAYAQEDTFATCQMPEGSESLYITEAAGIEIPHGLEDMYALMLDTNDQSDVYITRMRYGRALASISCTSAVGPGAAEELLALWPEAARCIFQDVSYINDSASCAGMETAFGYDALVIRTEIAVGEENMVLLEAKCAAFYNGPDLIEVWTLLPADSVYLYDEQAAAELMSDRADLEAFIDSLSFPPNENTQEK